MKLRLGGEEQCFFIEFHSSLNLSKSFFKVPIISVYEFGRNYAKLQKSGHLDTVVPVPLCLVPVPNTFCMVVPVHLLWYRYQMGSVW